MTTRTGIEARLKRLEHRVAPPQTTHVFVFMGFEGDGPAKDARRREVIGPNGEALVYIGFDALS